MSILEVNGVRKVYATRFGGNKVEALKNVTFSVERGEYVAIMGESGSGKTTLLNILAALDKPTDGTVKLEGMDLSKVKESQMGTFRRDNLGFVFQDFNLMDSLSVKENIMLPVLLDKKEQKECEEKAETLEKQFGIEHLQEKNPYELSGGERQRVAICRALINDPSIIFADEPTGNLDSKSGKVVAEEFRKINEELGKTLLMVTHDPQMASRCKRVIFLKDGYVMNDVRKEGTEEEFYRTIIGEMEKF